MHKKICTGGSSAIPGDGTNMFQSSSDCAQSPGVKPPAMSESDLAKLQKKVLQTAKSPQHFLASITLPMLKAFLRKHIDIKPFEIQLKRTSDWVQIILKKWQNEGMELQVRPIRLSYGHWWTRRFFLDVLQMRFFSSHSSCFFLSLKLCCLVH